MSKVKLTLTWEKLFENIFLESRCTMIITPPHMGFKDYYGKWILMKEKHLIKVFRRYQLESIFKFISSK